MHSLPTSKALHHPWLCCDNLPKLIQARCTHYLSPTHSTIHGFAVATYPSSSKLGALITKSPTHSTIHGFALVIYIETRGFAGVIYIPTHPSCYLEAFNKTPDTNQKTPDEKKRPYRHVCISLCPCWIDFPAVGQLILAGVCIHQVCPPRAVCLRNPQALIDASILGGWTFTSWWFEPGLKEHDYELSLRWNQEIHTSKTTILPLVVALFGMVARLTFWTSPNQLGCPVLFAGTPVLRPSGVGERHWNSNGVGLRSWIHFQIWNHSVKAWKVGMHPEEYRSKDGECGKSNHRPPIRDGYVLPILGNKVSGNIIGLLHVKRNVQRLAWDLAVSKVAKSWKKRSNLERTGSFHRWGYPQMDGF